MTWTRNQTLLVVPIHQTTQMGTNGRKDFNILGGAKNKHGARAKRDFFRPPDRDILQPGEFLQASRGTAARHGPDVAQRGQDHPRQGDQQSSLDKHVDKIPPGYPLFPRGTTGGWASGGATRVDLAHLFFLSIPYISFAKQRPSER